MKAVKPCNRNEGTRLDNFFQRRFKHHAGHYNFVQHEVHLAFEVRLLAEIAANLVGVENQVQLADILKALVKRLNKHLQRGFSDKSRECDACLDQVQDAELAFRGVDSEDEVQGGVVPVDQSHILAKAGGALEEVADGVCRKVHSTADCCEKGCMQTWPLGDKVE